MNMKRFSQLEDRRQTAYEKMYTAKIRKALIGQTKHYLETGDLDNSMRLVINEMYEVLMADYLQRQWVQLQNNTLEKKTNFFLDTWKRWIQDFMMEKLTMRVTNIDDTTRERLRNATLEGATAGETKTQIADRVLKIMESNATKQRARMIARTEVGEAVNLAKTKSADDWETETGMKIGKMWLHRGAKDPRDWHMSLDDGKVIPKDVPFIVNNPNTGESDKMMYPHDQSASAGNVINCGCQVLYRRMK